MTYWLWSVSPDAFPSFVRAGTFALRRQGARRLAEIAPGDRVFAYLSGQKVLAGEFEAVGTAFEDATALAPGVHAPHRLRVRPVAVLPDEARVPYDGFAPHLRVLDAYSDLAPERRFAAVAQRVVHPLPPIDGKVLQFVIQTRLGADPDALMAAVEAVRQARDDARAAPPAVSPRGPVARQAATRVAEPAAPYDASFDLGAAVSGLIDRIEASGFVYAPFEIAAYVAALRTRPFVLLAGITGIGKSRLPALVAQHTGGVATLVPVRPDWTDPAEALGYTDLTGRFRPGAVLRAAADAAADPARRHVVVLDEMNLGRPEHYLAEVLSRLEARILTDAGPASPPLLTERVGDAAWQRVGVPPNLGIVGTVNVDEGGHPLGRRVLDRAFTLELSARDLDRWVGATAETDGVAAAWPASAWQPRALRLAGLSGLTDAEHETAEAAVAAVAEADAVLAPAGLGTGFRTRDDVALFALHARDTPDAWRDREGAPVDPLDLALRLRLVPRLDGVRAAARDAIGALLRWAGGGDALADWRRAARPDALGGARFPRTAARLARIVEAAEDDGVASFWA